MKTKNILCFLLCTSTVFLFQTVSAQTDSTKIKKIQILTHGTYSDEEFYINPGLGFKSGRHTIFAGALLWRHYIQGFIQVGFFGGYTYEPGFRFKRLSTFLLFHVQQAKYLNEVRSVEPQVGYGIKINLFKNLYLSQSFSGGAIYYWHNKPATGEYFFSPDIYFTSMVRIGLHYDINLSKK